MVTHDTATATAPSAGEPGPALVLLPVFVEPPLDVSPEPLHDLLGSSRLSKVWLHQGPSVLATSLTILLDYFHLSSLLSKVVAEL